MLKPIFSILAVLLGFHMKAQSNNDPIFLNVQYNPISQYQTNLSTQSCTYIEFNMTTPPIKLSPKINLYNVLYGRYTAQSYTRDGIASIPFVPPNLYYLRYSLALKASLSPYWETLVMPRILLRSDLDQSISDKDFFLNFVLLAYYSVNKNPNFKIGFGLALNNDFSHNAIIPTGTLYYESKKIRIELAYPSTSITYKYSNDFEFGIYGNLDASISSISAYDGYYKSVQINLAPTVSYRIYKNIFSHFKIGYSSRRTNSLLDNNFELIQNSEYSLNPSVFFKTGLSYRLAN